MLTAATSHTDTEIDSAVRSLQGYGLIVLMLVACVIGLVVIILLLRTWRRFNKRLNRPRPDRQAIPDIWHESAERLNEADPADPDDDLPESEEYDPDDPGYPPPER